MLIFNIEILMFDNINQGFKIKKSLTVCMKFKISWLNVIISASYFSVFNTRNLQNKKLK